MLPSKSQHSILLVSSAQKGVAFLGEMLDHSRYAPIAVASSGLEARRLLSAEYFDIILVDAPLSDEFGRELALYAADNTVAGIVLLVRGELFDEISYQVEEYGVLTVAKPVYKTLFVQALRLATATRERLRSLEKENRKLQVKLEEIRLVNRAKFVLMEYLKMTEAQAHHYIEKQAMDLRLQKRAVAENILKTYAS